MWKKIIIGVVLLVIAALLLSNISRISSFISEKFTENETGDASGSDNNTGNNGSSSENESTDGENSSGNGSGDSDSSGDSGSSDGDNTGSSEVVLCNYTARILTPMKNYIVDTSSSETVGDYSYFQIMGMSGSYVKLKALWGEVYTEEDFVVVDPNSTIYSKDPYQTYEQDDHLSTVIDFTFMSVDSLKDGYDVPLYLSYERRAEGDLSMFSFQDFLIDGDPLNPNEVYYIVTDPSDTSIVYFAQSKQLAYQNSGYCINSPASLYLLTYKSCIDTNEYITFTKQ